MHFSASTSVTQGDDIGKAITAALPDEAKGDAKIIAGAATALAGALRTSDQAGISVVGNTGESIEVRVWAIDLPKEEV